MTSIARSLLQLCVAALLVRSGYSIKCYVCQSRTEPKCADPMDPTVLEPMECTMDMLKSVTNTVSKTLQSLGNSFVGDLLPPGMNNLNMDMACQKIDFAGPDNQKVTVRSCSFAKSDTVDACELIKSKNEQSQDSVVSYCDLCTEDGCNASGRIALPGWLALLLLSVLAARH